jgi:hypothetical protein
MRSSADRIPESGAAQAGVPMTPMVTVASMSLIRVRPENQQLHASLPSLDRAALGSWQIGQLPGNARHSLVRVVSEAELQLAK